MYYGSMKLFITHSILPVSETSVCESLTLDRDGKSTPHLLTELDILEVKEIDILSLLFFI